MSYKFGGFGKGFPNLGTHISIYYERIKGLQDSTGVVDGVIAYSTKYDM